MMDTPGFFEKIRAAALLDTHMDLLVDTVPELRRPEGGTHISLARKQGEKEVSHVYTAETSLGAEATAEVASAGI